MDSTTVLAWIGAITGTSAIIWDVVKWKLSGARIKVEVRPGETMPGLVPQPQYALVRVTNTGHRTTTVTNIDFYHYQSEEDKKNKQFDFKGYVLHRDPDGLPASIGPGGQWYGLVENTPQFKKCCSDGFLYCEIYHSLSNKAVITRIYLPELDAPKANLSTQ